MLQYTRSAEVMELADVTDSKSTSPSPVTFGKPPAFRAFLTIEYPILLLHPS